MTEFNSWLSELVYLTLEQRSMLSKCMYLLTNHNESVSDEWLYGSLEPLSSEDKNKFIELSNLIYMQNKMGV
jgi:hypothetical protein